MSRATYGLVGVLILTLVVFGSIADRALLDQARRASEASRAADDRTAQLTAQAVRAAVAEVEQAVLADKPWSSVRVARGVNSSQILARRPACRDEQQDADDWNVGSRNVPIL